MNLILLNESQFSNLCTDSSQSLLKFALSSKPLSDVVIGGLSSCLVRDDEKGTLSGNSRGIQPDTIFAVPQNWVVESDVLIPIEKIFQQAPSGEKSYLISYTNDIQIQPELVTKARQKPTMNSWFVISNGRFAPQTNYTLHQKILGNIAADVVAVNLNMELLSEHEKVRLTTNGIVAGLCRLYYDSAELTQIPKDWPNFLFVRTNVLEKLLIDGGMSLSFSTLMERCKSNNLTVKAVCVGGKVLDLETESGMLVFCGTKITDAHDLDGRVRNTPKMFPDVKFVGNVLLGENVTIESGVVVVGPSFIGDDVNIKQNAIIHSSIIASAITIPPKQYVNNCIIRMSKHDYKTTKNSESKKLSLLFSMHSGHFHDDSSPFRIWSRFSYVRFFKRIVDCIVAIMVLVLFLPLMPLIALAIKLNSPGPVFYGDKRQGLHGKNFHCLKFRTMITGANKIQEKLRVVSQVDGPQFKMDDDPRISTVGRFLRETYIDEIPQFFNVLLGQMSVVGPRPSPESENTLCPFWRDARLSVRPGVTGMWQVHRTREAMKDFQEWIYYDTEYVRCLSLKTDLLICFQTTKKMIGSFISQF